MAKGQNLLKSKTSLNFKDPHPLLKQRFKWCLTSDFPLIIIVVTGGEKCAKNQSRHIDFLHLVFHHRDTLAIVPNLDFVVFTERKNNQRNLYFKQG